MNGHHPELVVSKSTGLHASALAILALFVVGSHSFLSNPVLAEAAAPAYGSAPMPAGAAPAAAAPAAAPATSNYSFAATNVGVAPPEMEKVALPVDKLSRTGTTRAITSGIEKDAADAQTSSAAFLLLVEQGDRFRNAAPPAAKMPVVTTPLAATAGNAAPRDRLLTSAGGAGHKGAKRGIASIAGGSSTATRNTSAARSGGISKPRQAPVFNAQAPIVEEEAEASEAHLAEPSGTTYR